MCPERLELMNREA